MTITHKQKALLMQAMYKQDDKEEMYLLLSIILSRGLEHVDDMISGF